MSTGHRARHVDGQGAATGSPLAPPRPVFRRQTTGPRRHTTRCVIAEDAASYAPIVSATQEMRGSYRQEPTCSATDEPDRGEVPR